MTIGRLRPRVAGFDIKPQAADVLPRSGQSLNVLEQRAKNPLAAKWFQHIDALNPPEISIAPVAPLARDQKLAGELAVSFCHEINSLARIVQQRLNPRRHRGRGKPALLGLPRQPPVAVHDERRVGRAGLADLRFDAGC